MGVLFLELQLNMEGRAKARYPVTMLEPTEKPVSNRLVNKTLRWWFAGFNFAIAFTLLLLLDFGPRGPHFDNPEQYASKLVADDGNDYSLPRLRLLSRCVGYVRTNYVDPSRANAREMVVSSLDEVERAVPSLISDAVLSRNGDIRGIRIRVGKQEQEFDLSRVTGLYTMNWKLLDIFEFIAPNLPPDIDPREVEYAAVNGILRTLDPHSMLLDPRLYREMKLGTSGRFGGLGIVIGTRESQLVIQSVLEDTPAEKAGLRPKDRIVQIGAESTMNMSLTEAVNRLRGAPGTPVVIWIMRKSYTEAQRLRIVRSNITLVSVQSKLLDNGVGYVHIKNFQQDTSKDLRRAIESLGAKNGGTIKGLVLDLRNNPGGLLNQAVQVSDLFLTHGNVVTTVGSGNKVREEKIASPNHSYAHMPLVLLVNAESASASEIVAGAIRNHDRGLIIGQQTFGKGSVQVIYEVDDAALKLTIAQYLTPGDESIQGVGITPHIELTPMTVSEKRIELNVASVGGESRFENHLRNDERIHKYQPQATLQYLEFFDAKSEDPDFPVRLAARLILDAGHARASRMLKRARPVLALAQREQGKRLVEALGRMDVDWQSGKSPVAPQLKSKLEFDAGSEGLEAGQKVTLTMTVSNTGTQAVYRVRGQSQSEVELFNDLQFVLGRIPAGQERKASVTVDIPRFTASQFVPVNANLFLDSSTTAIQDVESARAQLILDGLARPRFAYTLQVHDSEGNGDGVINAHEVVVLKARIRNIGKGKAFNVLATLKNEGNEAVFISKGRDWLRGLAPLEVKEASFELEVREEIDPKNLKLQLTLVDTVLRSRMRHTLKPPYVPSSTRKFSKTDEQWRTSHSPSAVYSGADTNTHILGFLPPDTLIHSDGKVGDWHRVPLSNGGHCWIPHDGLKTPEAGARVPNKATLTQMVQIQQPNIELTGTFANQTKGKQIRLRGEALFPWLEKGKQPDLYIFRGRHKIYYSAVESAGARRILIDATVPLEVGPNSISIHARAGNSLIYKKEVMVFRHPLEEKR
jgi:carboxyl-terminal processing protease